MQSLDTCGMLLIGLPQRADAHVGALGHRAFVRAVTVRAPYKALPWCCHDSGPRGNWPNFRPLRRSADWRPCRAIVLLAPNAATWRSREYSDRWIVADLEINVFAPEPAVLIKARAAMTSRHARPARRWQIRPGQLCK